MKNTCCGKPMSWSLGAKVETDPTCRDGKRIRHNKNGCACTYRKLLWCRGCRKIVVEKDSTIAPYLLINVFSVSDFIHGRKLHSTDAPKA